MPFSTPNFRRLQRVQFEVLQCRPVVDELHCSVRGDVSVKDKFLEVSSTLGDFDECPREHDREAADLNRVQLLADSSNVAEHVGVLKAVDSQASHAVFAVANGVADEDTRYRLGSAGKV